MLFFILWTFLFLSLFFKLSAQVTDSLPFNLLPKLPFTISEDKRLSAEDLKNKKEGFYVTGAPDLSIDPLNGFGYGVGGFLFFNGKRKDPFFAYTPYRQKIYIELFNTTRNKLKAEVVLDVPYIFNSK